MMSITALRRLVAWMAAFTLGAFSLTLHVAAQPEFVGPNLISDGHRSAVNLIVADLDQDGDEDIVVAQASAGWITWHENNGTGSFLSHTVSAGLGAHWGIDVADVDGDGLLDILTTVAGGAEEILWLRNVGGAPLAFVPHVIQDRPDSSSNGPRAVVAADFDGDGDIDAASASDSDDFIGWHENVLGDGTSWTTHPFLPVGGAWGVEAVDFDQDGDPDILMAARDADRINWYENDGSGSFTRRTVATGINQARWAFAGDLDGDGDLDVTAGSSGDGLAWLRNNGGSPPSFTEFPIASSQSEAWSARPADLDGDGDLDLVVAHDTVTPSWFENNGEPTPAFTEHRLQPVAEGTIIRAESGDFDADGDLDIAIVSFVPGGQGTTVSWYENDPAPYRGRAIFRDASVDGVHMPGEPGSMWVFFTVPQTEQPFGTVTLNAQSLTEGFVLTNTTATGPLAPFSAVVIFDYTVNTEIPCSTPLEVTLEAVDVAGPTQFRIENAKIGGTYEVPSLVSAFPQAGIPDGDSEGCEVCLTVDAPGMTVVEAVAQVVITHPRPSDLLVELVAPTGEIATLFEGQPEDEGPNLVAQFSVPSFQGLVADGDFCFRVIDRDQGVSGRIDALTLQVSHTGFVCEPWSLARIIDVLLGFEEPLPWRDYTGDGQIDAADAVTAANAGAP